MNEPVRYTQAGRLMAIETVLGEDALLLERFEIEEGINRLFTLQARVRAQRAEVRPEEIVGTAADLLLTLADGSQRAWNGLVTELHEGPLVTRGARQYALTLRPRLWLMSQRRDCRIFLEQSTLEVLETLCREHGIRDYDLAGITKKPEKRDYVVQWNETDLAYLLRRLEEEGHFYWFAHERGRHTLKLGDHPYAYDGSAETQVRLAFGSSDAEHIHDWRRQVSFTPGRRAGKDYEFLTPNLDLASRTPSIDRVPENAAYELYEYPARALTREASEQASRLRVQATEGDFDRVEGRSSVRTLAAGARFTPYEVAHPDHVYPAQVVTQILHRAEDPTYESGAGTPHYENSFATLPADRPATPHRTIPRPRIDGLQIARIAGPAGEEIHTDAYGRVKLAFPWDRRAKGDGTDTGWVRVTQSWGGTTWGQQIIPRVGMEALVAYQEGDPDRPIVTGIAPNPNNPVPYELPVNKTRMVLRSDSYKASGYNELAFEDQGGRECLHMLAQKDQTHRVGDTLTQHVQRDAIRNVGANHSLQVGANMQHNVGGGMSIAVGAVGGAVPRLVTATLAGLMGQSSGLLGEAMGVVSGALQQATASGLSEAPGGGAAGAAAAALGPDAPTGSGSGADSALGGIASTVASYAAALAGSGPALMNAGAAANALAGVASPEGIARDAGGAVAAAGADTGRQVAGMIGSGILNQVVGRLQNNSVGLAQTEQIGAVKALSVGNVYTQKIGNQLKIDVGDEVIISVGPNGSAKSLLIMKGDGTILLKGIKIFVEGDSHIQMLTPMLDHN